MIGFDRDHTSSKLEKVLANKSSSASLYQPNQWMHAVNIHLCQVSVFYNSWVCFPIILYADIFANAGFGAASSLSSSWCEASSLRALEHAGGSELCSVWVRGMVQLAWIIRLQYKTTKYSCIQTLMCYVLRPLQDFSRVKFCADSIKVLRLKL